MSESNISSKVQERSKMNRETCLIILRRYAENWCVEQQNKQQQEDPVNLSKCLVYKNNVSMVNKMTDHLHLLATPTLFLEEIKKLYPNVNTQANYVKCFSTICKHATEDEKKALFGELPTNADVNECFKETIHSVFQKYTHDKMKPRNGQRKDKSETESQKMTKKDFDNYVSMETLLDGLRIALRFINKYNIIEHQFFSETIQPYVHMLMKARVANREDFLFMKSGSAKDRAPDFNWFCKAFTRCMERMFNNKTVSMKIVRMSMGILLSKKDNGDLNYQKSIEEFMGHSYAVHRNYYNLYKLYEAEVQCRFSYSATSSGAKVNNSFSSLH
ncbi:TPA_asm: YRec [Powellomyces chytrid fungus MELD virus 2]|nr:TPA_asm: YRec [Powellomyces chytrid fungus MELD virus 2]